MSYYDQCTAESFTYAVLRSTPADADGTPEEIGTRAAAIALAAVQALRPPRKADTPTATAAEAVTQPDAKIEAATAGVEANDGRR